jgi:hypothetical protein
MPRYQDEYDNDNESEDEHEEDIWADAYTCHCSSFSKPWCNCDKTTCPECISDEEFYANADDYDGFGFGQDFINPETQWKYSIHYEFGDQTNELFATLLLGLQRLEDTSELPLAHQAMLEEMLEHWKYGYLPVMYV